MAKYSINIEPQIAREYTIPRAALMRMVEAGIGRAFHQHSEEDVQSQVQPDLLREIARTTDRIDAKTWRATNSCGCPMVKAGRVTHSTESRNEPPSAISDFVYGYDTAAGDYLTNTLHVGGSGAVTFIIEG